MRAHPYLIGSVVILLAALSIMASRRQEFKDWEEDHEYETGNTYAEDGVS